jgi:hypothetical protein
LRLDMVIGRGICNCRVPHTRVLRVGSCCSPLGTDCENQIIFQTYLTPNWQG